MAVGGLMDRPISLFKERIFQSRAVTRWPSSTCTVIRSAPARAKGSSRISGREHMRWTSKTSLLRGRIAPTTAGPKEMLGTKWPSTMSRCSQSAPERSRRAASWPSLAKLDASSEGAIIIGAKANELRPIPSTGIPAGASCHCHHAIGRFPRPAKWAEGQGERPTSKKAG